MCGGELGGHRTFKGDWSLCESAASATHLLQTTSIDERGGGGVEFDLILYSSRFTDAQCALEER